MCSQRERDNMARLTRFAVAGCLFERFSRHPTETPHKMNNSGCQLRTNTVKLTGSSRADISIRIHQTAKQFQAFGRRTEKKLLRNEFVGRQLAENTKIVENLTEWVATATSKAGYYFPIIF